MTISISKRAKEIIDAAVASGRYVSEQDVIDAGLQLLAENENKLAWLRSKVQQSIAEGGELTDEEVAAEIRTGLDEWERRRRGQ